MNQQEHKLFKNWHWNECLECLDNIVRYSDSIVLVSSPIDNGKTTLKQEFVNLLGAANFKVFSMYGEQQTGVATMMRQVTIGFGLPWDNNNSSNWSELQKAIFSQPNCRWVLCVDDAEKLSWDTLNALISLYNLISSEGSQFSLIFFADPSLEESLKRSVLKDFVINKFQMLNLKALTLLEASAFLNSINLNFDNKTLKKIYNASGGIIGKVKQLATSELNIKHSESKINIQSLLANIINPPVIRICVCCGLLVAAYSVFTFMQRKDSWSKAAIALEKPIETVIETPIIVADNKTADNSEEIYQKLYTNLQANLQANLQEYLQAELNKIALNNLNNIKDNIKDLANQLEQKTPEIKKTIQSTKKPGYTLQIMASKKEQSVKKLFANYPGISQKSKYFLVKFKPQQKDPWFLVIHGNYASREAAINDINNLPIDIQNLKPIVRNYEVINKLINNQKEAK